MCLSTEWDRQICSLSRGHPATHCAGGVPPARPHFTHPGVLASIFPPSHGHKVKAPASVLTPLLLWLLFVREYILFCCHCLAEGRALQRSHVNGGREGDLQGGARTTVLPAQCDCGNLGSVGCKEGSLERNWALCPQIENIWEWEGAKNGFLSPFLTCVIWLLSA